MKAWVSSESFWECSVNVAVPLIMLVAPRVFQVVGVVKSPLVMPMRAPAVRLAVVLICWLLVALLLQMVLRMDRSRADGSLRTPGLRLVFIRS